MASRHAGIGRSVTPKLLAIHTPVSGWLCTRPCDITAWITTDRSWHRAPTAAGTRSEEPGVCNALWEIFHHRIIGIQYLYEWNKSAEQKWKSRKFPVSEYFIL